MSLRDARRRRKGSAKKHKGQLERKETMKENCFPCNQVENTDSLSCN
jgi:hypothetical protein